MWPFTYKEINTGKPGYNRYGWKMLQFTTPQNKLAGCMWPFTRKERNILHTQDT